MSTSSNASASGITAEGVARGVGFPVLINGYPSVPLASSAWSRYLESILKRPLPIRQVTTDSVEKTDVPGIDPRGYRGDLPQGIIEWMPATTSVSMIVPTYREAPNIEPLIRRAFAAVGEAGIQAEMIVVDDDSQDGTERIVHALAASYPVRILVRREERGLSSAVVAGFRQAKFDRLLVLDADLQHPPEMIPKLIAALDDPACDFAVGSRYGAGGAIADSWPWYRRLGSFTATILARPLAPLRDPMSGFFALRRSTWIEAAADVSPLGYKIGLELYVKARCHHPVEIPIRFESRAGGESKLNFRTQLAYRRHLRRLYAFRFPKLVWTFRLVMLAVVGYVAYLVVRAKQW